MRCGTALSSHETEIRVIAAIVIAATSAEPDSPRRTVAEGAFTAPVLARLARKKGIDMPVVAAVDKLLSGEANVDQVLQELLARPPRAEAS